MSLDEFEKFPDMLLPVLAVRPQAQSTPATPTAGNSVPGNPAKNCWAQKSTTVLQVEYCITLLIQTPVYPDIISVWLTVVSCCEMCSLIASTVSINH